MNENHAQMQAQIVGVMQWITQSAPLIQVSLAHSAPELSDQVEIFRKVGVVQFTGDTDLLAAYEWLTQTERIFRILECSGRHKVYLSTFMFEGVAEIWWRSVEEPYQTIEDGVVWETFKKQFLGRFSPEHVAIQKHIEFKLLRQGDMTVVEYIHQFSKLSRFVEELVNTEAKKIAQFIRGLHPTIHRDVTGALRPQTLDEAIQKAYCGQKTRIRGSLRN